MGQKLNRNSFLGIDLGGTGVKAGLFDTDGNLLGISKRSYHPEISKEGHVEIDIHKIYDAAAEAAREVIGGCRTLVKSLSISSQGQTFVTLDENNQPLHNAILWYDSRAVDQANRLNQALSGDETNEETPVVNMICTAAKILWLRETFPDLMSRAKRFLLLPDYFSYRLTGKAVIDASNATTTGLYTNGSPDFHHRALSATGLKREQMAEIAKPGTAIATLLPEAAKQWGMRPDTLLVTGTNDQYAGALGAGNCSPGIVSETTGTCLALVTLGKEIPDPKPEGIFAGNFPISPYKGILAFSKTAGLVLDWFKNGICPGMSLDELEKLATAVPIGSHGLTAIPHFDGMISPYPNPAARGAFLNLNLNHTRTDMYRAILESLAFSFSENLQLIRESGFEIESIRSIGGAATSDLLIQMKADVSGFPMERPVIIESAVLGAAILAAVGCGEYASVAECSGAFYKRERLFEPDLENHARYKEPFKRYLDFYRKLYG